MGGKLTLKFIVLRDGAQALLTGDVEFVLDPPWYPVCSLGCDVKIEDSSIIDFTNDGLYAGAVYVSTRTNLKMVGKVSLLQNYDSRSEVFPAGGSLHINKAAVVDISGTGTNVVIRDNYALSGGSIGILGGNLTIKDGAQILIENSNAISGGAVHLGIYVSQSTSSLFSHTFLFVLGFFHSF